MASNKVSNRQDAPTLNKLRGFTRTVGLNTVRIEDGEAELELELSQDHLNSGGIVHGGVLATLLDSAGGAAVFSVLPLTQFAPTTNMSISYMSSVGEGRLVARSKVQKQGSRMVYCESSVYCEEKLLATAQLSFMVMERDRPLQIDEAAQ